MFKIALPVIFILASIAGFVFYVNPEYKSAKKDNEKLIRVNDALKQANELRDLRDKLAEERKKISDQDLVRISRMIPDGVENIGLIIEMNNIARDKGMELLNPTIGPSVGGAAPAGGADANPALATSLDVGPDGSNHGALEMSFGVNTTYEKFIDFLKELERSLRLVDVKEITFSAPDSKTGRTTFSVTIETYWLK